MVNDQTYDKAQAMSKYLAGTVYFRNRIAHGCADGTRIQMDCRAIFVEGSTHVGLHEQMETIVWSSSTLARTLLEFRSQVADYSEFLLNIEGYKRHYIYC